MASPGLVTELTNDSLWKIWSARSLVSGLWTYHILLALCRHLRCVIERLSRCWTALQVFQSAKYLMAAEQTRFDDLLEAKNSKSFFFLYPFYKSGKTNTSVKSVTHETYLSVLRDRVSECLFRPLLTNLKAVNNLVAIHAANQCAFRSCSEDFSSLAFMDESTVDCSKLSQSDYLVSQSQTQSQEIPENSVWNGTGRQNSEEELMHLNTFDDESDSIISDDSEECFGEGTSEENEKLWNSFLKCSDPYRLFNFQACISSISTNESKFTDLSHNVNRGKNSKLSSEKNVLVTEAGTNVQPVCNAHTYHKKDKLEVNCSSFSFRGKTNIRDKPEDLDSFTKCKSSYSYMKISSKTKSAIESLLHLKYSDNCTGNVGEFEQRSSFCATINNCKDTINDLSSSNGNHSDDGDEDFESEDDRKAWDSFLTCKDPYNPLNFTACIATCPSITRSDNILKKKLDIEQLCSKKQRSEKKINPALSEWHFKHTCGSTDRNIMKVCVWKKPAKSSTADVALRQHQNKTLKQVRFSSVVHVHTMCAWSYALRAARKGPWEEMARDRARFQSRINESEKMLGHCFNKSYRKKVLPKIHAVV